MCSICKIRGKAVSYPHFQIVSPDGSLYADGKMMAACADVAKDHAKRVDGSIRIEPRQDESDVAPELRLVYDAVYAAAEGIH